MSKESKARYEHYKSNIYKQTMESVHNYRARMYYGMPLHEVPSILNATIAAERKAKKKAKAMVKEDKRLAKLNKMIAKLNKMKLKDFPRTEWALSLEDYEKAATAIEAQCDCANMNGHMCYPCLEKDYYAISADNFRLIGKIQRLQLLADDLADHLQGCVCHCNMSKCKCGYDDVMDLYREIRG